jgi:hypothetical protein
VSDSDLEYSGLDAAARLIGQDLRPILQAIILAIALEAQGRIAPYPAARPRKQPFLSGKQRRAFFAKLRKGQIKVPYQRSGQLGQKWIADKAGNPIVVRNTRRGARFVHSERDQSAYHRGNWKTDKGVAEQVVNDGTAARIAEQALQAAFDRGPG